MRHDSLPLLKGEFLVVEEDAIQELKFQRQFKNCIQSCVKLAYSVDPTMRQSRLPIRCNFSSIDYSAINEYRAVLCFDYDGVVTICLWGQTITKG